MGFVKHFSNFTKTELVQNAIVYASLKTGIDVAIVEEIIIDYFATLKQIIVDCIYDKISLYRWGTLRRIGASRDLVQLAIEEEYSHKLLEEEEEDEY